MPPETNVGELARQVRENTRLLEENTKLLHKIHRNYVWTMWMNVTWYLLIIGLPFAVYFYVLQPYFEALGSSYETFSDGIQELPGWKLFHQMVEEAGKSDGV